MVLGSGIPAKLGHYRIVEKIGEGGMGVVYRAHDEHLDCDVALKVLPAGRLADDTSRKRFRKEALALSKVNHPNIAVVHDFDTQEGTDFLVAELISGLSLSEMLISGPLPEREIVNLGSQLAEGLGAAHEQGVIHRDLKPSNIRVTPDARVKVLDFGLAKVLRTIALGSDAEVTASLTETQTIFGTLPYMAPEQLLNEKLDARTDIWAAGCVLYEMATGRRPFSGAGPALTEAILHQLPQPASALNHKIPPALDSIILKCLEKDPSLRYASARDIAVDLHRLSAGSSMIRVLPQPRRVRTRNFVIASALVALLVVAVVVISRFIPRPAADRVPQPSQVAASIAVLPFVDMSPEKDQEYFSDGLAEELLNDLTKIPGLRVTARTSSFQFKGKNEDLRVIGQKLNVSTILEGSVRKEGRRVRITAQLINVADGFRLWSETYDRELNDIFRVQEEISRSVAASLKVTLLGGKAPASRGTSEEAYVAYLQGRFFYQRTSKESLEKSVDYYEQSIKLDPRYAPAWAGLAAVRGLQVGLGWSDVPFEEGFRKAREAAERALALDANLAEAHAAVGWIKTYHDWDWTGADASYQRALALEPGNATVLVAATTLPLALGRSEEAMALARRAVELDPLNATSHHWLGAAAHLGGRLEEAIAAFKKALELNPQCLSAHYSLGLIYLSQSHPLEALAEMEREPEDIFSLQGRALAYHALGKKKESDAALAEYVAKYHAQGAYQIAEVYAFRGEADRAFEWLERAYAQRDPGLVNMKFGLLLKSVGRDPRYAAFLKKMRLPA